MPFRTDDMTGPGATLRTGAPRTGLPWGGTTMFDNLLDDLPNAADQEQLVDLLKHPGVRIERIVSTGQSSPPGKAGPRDDRIA